MTEPSHLALLPPCPYLPDQREPLGADCLNKLGHHRGPDFYLQALRYGQSLWLQGFPARAILLVNRALGADVAQNDPALARFPLPYMAQAWLLANHLPDQFLGNPRRHWQHLATRMVEPRRELRTWRAWACWMLARTVLPHLPADEEQIAREGIREPSTREIAEQLARLGHHGEANLFQAALSWAAAHAKK